MAFDVKYYGIFVNLICQTVEQRKNFKSGELRTETIKLKKDVYHFKLLKKNRVINEFTIDYKNECFTLSGVDGEDKSYIDEVLEMIFNLDNKENRL